MSTTTFVATALAVGLPWAFSLRKASLSWSTFISVLLLLHSLTGLHTLFLRSPPNVFKALQVPLNTPTDTIRAVLLQKSDAPDLDAELEELLRRLASSEVRTLYPRFGHNVIATCSYCHSFTDFAIYSLPRPIMSYIREAAFIGLITSHRRKPAVTSLFVIFLVEFYVLATVDIKIPLGFSSQTFATIWWHDALLNIRHAIFILLPIIIHFAPPFRIPFISRPAPPASVDTSALLAKTHQTLTHLLPTLHLLKYGQAATMRVPELRARASAWWEEEAKVGGWIREDGAGDSEEVSSTSVRSVARGLGTSFDEGGEGVQEGKLRTSAKNMTKILLIDGTKPSPNW